MIATARRVNAVGTRLEMITLSAISLQQTQRLYADGRGRDRHVPASWREVRPHAVGTKRLAGVGDGLAA